jgi:hypothetical protein
MEIKFTCLLHGDMNKVVWAWRIHPQVVHDSKCNPTDMVVGLFWVSTEVLVMRVGWVGQETNIRSMY